MEFGGNWHKISIFRRNNGLKIVTRHGWPKNTLEHVICHVQLMGHLVLGVINAISVCFLNSKPIRYIRMFSISLRICLHLLASSKHGCAL